MTGQPEDATMARPAITITGSASTSAANATTASNQRGRPLPATFLSGTASASISGADSFDSLNYVGNFFVAHSRKDWQADQPLPLRGGHRKIRGPQTKGLAVIRMQVQWAPVD